MIILPIIFINKVNVSLVTICSIVLCLPQYTSVPDIVLEREECNQIEIDNQPHIPITIIAIKLITFPFCIGEF